MRSLRPTAEQLSDLSRIALIALPDLESAVSALENDQPPRLVASDLRLFMAKHMENDKDATALVRQALALASFKIATDSSDDEVVESLLNGVKASDMVPQEISALSDRSALLKRALKSDSVLIAAKALFLSYEHAQIFSTARLITDIRPVFSRGRDEIFGGIVLSSLNIGYYSDGSSKELCLSLDEKDIDGLIKELESSKKKMAAAKELFSERLKLQAFIAGEETYGFGE